MHMCVCRRTRVARSGVRADKGRAASGLLLKSPSTLSQVVARKQSHSNGCDIAEVCNLSLGALPGAGADSPLGSVLEDSIVRHTYGLTCGLAMLLLLHTAPAHATPLLPGNTNILPTPLGSVGSIGTPTFLFDSGVLSDTFGGVTVHFGESIIKDPLAPLFSCGSDCLDFVLQVQLVGGPAGATTVLNSISMNTFGVSAVDVGWLEDHPAYIVPSGADRGPLGDTVFFDFSPGIAPGAGTDTSQILVIRTDRTSFSPQNFVGFTATETFATGQVSTPSALYSVQTAPVPEPSSLLLMAGGAVVAAFRKRRRAVRP